jgi:hypothetical protein
MGTNDDGVSVEKRTVAVVRLLKGESIEELSNELGVSVSELESWREAFMAAGTRQLSDADEIPEVEVTLQMSREDIQAALASAGGDEIVFELGDDEIETVEMDAPETTPIEKPDVQDEEPAAQPRGGERVFSETSWFMAPVDDEAVETDGEHVDVDKRSYEPKEGIPKDERRQYSLRSDEELDD